MKTGADTLIKFVKSHKDFLYFCEEILGYKANDNYRDYKNLTKEHRDLCYILQHGKKLSKLILMPRFSFKSKVVTEGFSLWRMVKNPNIRILIYSDSAGKASGFLQGIKNHIEGKAPNSEFRKYFPRWETQEKWNESQIVVRTRKVANKEPSVDTGGIESSKIGMHYDLIIFDDMVSDVNTTTKAQMDKVHDCYKKSLSLLKPGGETIIVGCLVAGSKVLMGDKSWKEIENVEIGEKVYSWKDKGLVKETVEAMIPQGKAPVYRLKTNNTTIEATANHPFLNSKGKFVRLDALKKGDKIVLSGMLDDGVNDMKLTEEDCWGLGFMFGDGGKAKTKRLPKYLYNLPLNLRHKFIKGFVDADGHSKDGRIDIEICNENLIKDLKHLAEISGYKVSNVYHRRRLSKPPNSKAEFVSYSYHISMSCNKPILSQTRIVSVCSIEYVGIKEVYDLTISNTHNFISEGMVVHNTRWHYGDAYGRIIEENGDKQNFDIFIRDAEKFNDDGKLIFEDIGLNREFLDNQRREQGSYIFSCLYRNSPVDDETAIFKSSDFQYYTPTPDFHKNMWITCTCDPAGEGEDYTAITVVGTDKSKNLYVLDAVNEHLKPNQIIEKIIMLNYKWEFNRFGIETNFFKGMIEKELRAAIEEECKNKLFKPFSVEEIMASKKQRTFTRILSLQPYHERKAVYFPGKGFNQMAKVYTDLAFQMIHFTIDGSKSPNDDLLISFAMHVELSIPGGDVEKEGPKYTSAAWFERQMYDELMSRNSNLPSRYRQQFEPVFS